MTVKVLETEAEENSISLLITNFLLSEVLEYLRNSETTKQLLSEATPAISCCNSPNELNGHFFQNLLM